MGVTGRGFVFVAYVALPETSRGFWVLANLQFYARFSFFFFSHSPFDMSFLIGWMEKMAENVYSLSFSWLAFGEKRKIYWALVIKQTNGSINSFS